MVQVDFLALQDKISEVKKDDIYEIICKNIKKYRLEKYNEFKQNKNNGTLNPYTTENIAALLDYYHNHYKRFESENDSIKKIPLEKIIKLSIILEKSLDDFIKKNRK